LALSHLVQKSCEGNKFWHHVSGCDKYIKINFSFFKFCKSFITCISTFLHVRLGGRAT
jgi:hypothetical protein